MAPSAVLTRDAADELLPKGMRPAVERSRLGAYAALGGSVAALPLPWLPNSLLRRIRGALVHDLAVRQGLSLTPEARAVLSEPSRTGGPRGFGSQVLSYVGVRLAVRGLARFGPIAAIWPVRDAIRTYVLGHLFERYVQVVRSEHAVRIDEAEARRVRRAVDGALARAITIGGSPAEKPIAMDDQREAITALVDGLIGVLTGLPDRLVSRLEAAFDELLFLADG